MLVVMKEKELGLITTFSCAFSREKQTASYKMWHTILYISFSLLGTIRKVNFLQKPTIRETDTFLNVANRLLNGRNRN